MNIILIATTPPDINAFGIRTIASVLKREGYSIKIIFLPGGIEYLRFDGSYKYQYPEKTLKQISEICNNAGLIGFSFMSQYFDRAVQITEYLKHEHKSPIIWGGVHPTYRPEQCLSYCDIVCIGEGENAVVEVVNRISKGEDYTNTDGCWFKIDNKIKKNNSGLIVQNLDNLPFIDYEIEDHYVYNWRTEDIITIDEDVMREQFPKLTYFGNKNLITYRTMTSRGCPHKCSFCASSAMMQLRRRSVDNLINELKLIRERFEYIELISFFDDTFFAASTEYFEEFRDKYKSKIGIPFHAQCSPGTINETKMSLLIDAGLFWTEMGIQTGSEKTKKLYRRVTSNQKILYAAHLIDSYSSRMIVPEYHIILDNPWEDKEDVLQTLNLLLKLPGRFKLQISSLVFFPGTELNERALKEGIIKDELTEVCRKPFTYPKGNYLNYLIYLTGFHFIPRWLLKILSRETFVSLLHSQKSSRGFDFLFIITNKLRIICKGVKALFTGDFNRIMNYFRLVR